MCATKPTLILFLGELKGSEAEEKVSACHRAIALDVLERARESNGFGEAILVTDDARIVGEVNAEVKVDITKPPFHFGEKLREVIEKYRIEKPFCVSRGSLPLFSASQLGQAALRLSSASNVVVTNNLFSADLVAFSPGKAIELIDLPLTDNALPRLLQNQVGLAVEVLPRTAASLFDVDTPADMFVLALHPGAGKRTRQFIDGLDLDCSAFHQATRFLADVNAEVLVAGRVGSYVWQRLEADTSCRVRVLAEERGMQADGREIRGEAHSILGFYLEQVGVSRFFETLAHLAQAAFVDTRVIFAHLGLKPSRADRFYSDLREPDRIKDPFIREFTLGAIQAPIPIIMGGHSMVAGGLLALIEAARFVDNPAPRG